MNYKKKGLVLGIFLIITIQIILVINNNQKTSIRFFIWKIQELSIGKLVSLSFISGLVISSILNKTKSSNFIPNASRKEDIESDLYNDSIINENSFDSSEIPPQRDIRDTQPTVSVNYRVIKKNKDNGFSDNNEISKESDSKDDWGNNEAEW